MFVGLVWGCCRDHGYLGNEMGKADNEKAMTNDESYEGGKE